MPIYEYRCCKCLKVFEEIRKIKDNNSASYNREYACCSCGYIANRTLPSTFNFKLKGGGWFRDGYVNGKK